MKYEFVRVDHLRPRYRIIYLVPMILGLFGGLFAGIVAISLIVELFELATDTRGGAAITVLLLLFVWAVFFVVFAIVAVGTMIALRIISQNEGRLILSGRGVPDDWYRSDSEL